MSEGADTVTHYDRNADAFAAQTADLDLTPLYDRFLRRVPPRGQILDAGCGVGRDALAFTRRGHGVVAFDASPEMVRLARARVGHRAVVRLLRFEEVAWREAFDAVWACASLLHVPPAAFPGVARRLADALRPGGAWYMSFKLGAGERVAGGRIFVDHTAETLRGALQDVPVDFCEAWLSTDVRPGRGSGVWLNAIAVRR